VAVSGRMPAARPAFCWWPRLDALCPRAPGVAAEDPFVMLTRRKLRGLHTRFEVREAASWRLPKTAGNCYARRLPSLKTPASSEFIADFLGRVDGPLRACRRRPGMFSFADARRT